MESKEAQTRYAHACEVIARGREAFAEGHRLLQDIRPGISHARSRGHINQQIWECRRLLGRTQHYFSQAGQDAWLDDVVFKGKRDGVFVEIGGFDGLTGSNCLFFELMRGWRGILIEPSPLYFEQARAFRRATCLQVAVADTPGEAEFMEVQKGYSQMSGLTASYDPELREKVEANPQNESSLITVRTETLPTLLDQHSMHEIDYISLDVEGGEMAVLASFPFETYKVRAWTIENNTADTDVPKLMRDKGYSRVEALGVDDVYVMGANP